jgi:hypothetical protein
MRIRSRFRIRSRVRKFVFWGALLILATLAGGLWMAYLYVTDGATLAALIESEVPRYLPGSRLVLGRVKLRPYMGELQLLHVALRQKIDGAEFEAAKIPWLRVRHDTRALLEGKFLLREVVVAQPELRLRRRKDGTWNLQGLMADPWPGPPMQTPPILIQNGTLELVDPESRVTAILREVSVRVESGGPQLLAFEGSARGDAFDRLRLQGTVHLGTGVVTLKGDVARLELSETLRGRLPAELRPRVQALGLTSGTVDLQIGGVVYDPAATPRIRYQATAQLRSGRWNCPRLPFPIDDLSAGVSVRDGVLTIERAEGYHGNTVVRVHQSTLVMAEPERAPLNLRVDVIDLELDEKLRQWTPPVHAGLWDEFSPKGRLSVGVHVVRDRLDGPLGFGVGIDCRDVSMEYKYFRYPLDHVHGRIAWEGQQVTLDLHTLVGGKPLHAQGTIINPGDLAHVILDFEGEALPIDETLFRALPPDIRKVVGEFQPTGSVRGHAHLDRTPPVKPTDPPEGFVKIDAVLDLNERCTMKWVGLPYPVSNLTGRLELHPDRWVFTNMRGSNGQAVITGSGAVEQVEPNQLKVDLHLQGQRLPFDDQLRTALPPAWQKTWATLDPVGSCDVDARIQVAPRRPDRYYLKIDPGPATGIRPRFQRVSRPGVDPGGTIELRMEDIDGQFVFDNGTVWMSQVGFQFHDAPVQFARGKVVVEDSGRFDLEVFDLRAQDFRLDSRLRDKMPPVMRDFARRLDDGKPFRINGNLKLDWSGQPGKPARCRWDHVLVVFNDNTIQAGLPLEHIQGQLENVWGSSDGADLEVHGALALYSVSLLGLQVTRLESPLDVKNGVAGLSSLRGQVLGGEVLGRFEVSLDATPRYTAALSLRGADLQSYARTIPGRQRFRGQVAGELELSGLGNDLRTLQGRGEAHITQGDLGELPAFLALLKILRLSPATKTAFDSADVAYRIENGKTLIDPVRFTGDAFSLKGRGTLDVQGDLDLRLQVLLGRDRFHLFLLSDALREASGQFFLVRVQGTPSFPKFGLEPLPMATDAFNSLGTTLRNGRAAGRGERTTGP